MMMVLILGSCFTFCLRFDEVFLKRERGCLRQGILIKINFELFEMESFWVKFLS